MRQSIHHRFESLCGSVQGLIISVSSAGYAVVQLGVQRVQLDGAATSKRSHN